MQTNYLSSTASSMNESAELQKPLTMLRNEGADAETSRALSLLVVDDDPAVLRACCEIARSMGYRVVDASSVEEARNELARQQFDVLLLDLKLPVYGGLTLLDEVTAVYPNTAVIVMTAFATVNNALEAMRTGAQDYLTKPFAMDELTVMLERAGNRKQFESDSRRLRDRTLTQTGMIGMVGHSSEMQKLYRIVSKVAFSSHPVLIMGESGTGKELVARSIHANGPKASRPFISVDCGSLVPKLVESELFGYAKGAFTGASRSRDGLLATAGGGTVFLDEVGELSLELQAKLLRALQEKEVHPVGATHAVPISARVVAATNRDLSAMVEQGRFRKDLYFRLNVVNVRMPSLRSRKQDIPLLAAHFLERMRKENGVLYKFSDEVLRVMAEYEWPGNVRELENAIERACALSSGPILHMADMPSPLQNFSTHTSKPSVQKIDERRVSSRRAADVEMAMQVEASRHRQIVSIAELEKQAILSTIRQLHGDKLMAARLLGIGKTTLYRKLKEYGIGE
ncbi:two component, sigma54 specific, transcriptional regulator, Fis family [Terriglobus saanensis SP1PR4]|uniref:Two component, sigma54 specific, transcriptional regulator, Fis family n=2 Tax=Terriglobus saanensis TaxID=870903 RepID=E8V6E8_TERSS|nr:two component, sigma54 specific, transcriptional regulator, Fis family [Terriglobus saanensis SP1PR4]